MFINVFNSSTHQHLNASFNLQSSTSFTTFSCSALSGIFLVCTAQQELECKAKCNVTDHEAHAAIACDAHLWCTHWDHSSAVSARPEWDQSSTSACWTSAPSQSGWENQIECNLCDVTVSWWVTALMPSWGWQTQQSQVQAQLQQHHSVCLESASEAAVVQEVSWGADSKTVRGFVQPGFACLLCLWHLILQTLFQQHCCLLQFCDLINIRVSWEKMSAAADPTQQDLFIVMSTQAAWGGHWRAVDVQVRAEQDGSTAATRCCQGTDASQQAAAEVTFFLLLFTVFDSGSSISNRRDWCWCESRGCCNIGTDALQSRDRDRERKRIKSAVTEEAA